MPRRPTEPLPLLLGLQERMNRLFSDTLERLDSPATGAWSPASDLQESGDAVVLVMDLPGLAEEDVEIEAEAGRLTVRGERRPPPCPRNTRFHSAERSYGRFSRSFELGSVVDPHGVRFRLEDGVLSVEVPKRQS